VNSIGNLRTPFTTEALSTCREEGTGLKNRAEEIESGMVVFPEVARRGSRERRAAGALK
jgi:hypothetical protein